MTRLRQIAVAGAGSAMLLLGLAGCATENNPIGPGAMLESAGNKTVAWTASSPGRLSVFDESSEKVVYGADVMAGQTVSVDTDNNRVLLDSQLVSENSLHRGDEYRIYFQPTATVHTSESYEQHSVTTVH